MDNQRRATCWSVTINMNTTKRETAEEWIHTVRSKGWRVSGQIEQAPTTGTLHYQLMVETPQTRFSAIKKAFPTAHIEICRNKAALSQYVEKADTRVAGLVQEDDKYPSIAKFWRLIYKFYDVEDDSGWDMCDDQEVMFCDADKQARLEKDPLAFLDDVTSELIREGYVVDHIITNPAVRSFWKKFYAAILFRTRETDRQTDTVVLATTSIPNATQSEGDGSGDSISDRDSGEEDRSSSPSDEGSCDEDCEDTDCSSDGEQGGWV